MTTKKENMERSCFLNSKNDKIYWSVRPRPLQFMISILLLLFLVTPPSSSSGFDLLSSLMSHGSSSLSSPNLKSLVSPEMLSRLKGLLPSLPNMGSQTDLAQIEKLIAKLKPVEGRFDPAMLELLANMDARMPPGITSQKLDHHLHHQDRHHRKKYDEDHHHYHSPMSSTTSASSNSNGFTITTPADGRQKFSSKFRLDEEEDGPDGVEEGEDEENYSDRHPPSLLPPMASIIPQPKTLDHITDPNIRNHRLYELEQERFENYENFTALDQIEDLLAEESHPHQVFVPFENSPASKHRKRYKSTTSTTSSTTLPPIKSTTSGTSGWIGKPFTPRRPSSSHHHLDDMSPAPTTSSSSSSYEEVGGSEPPMSIESVSAPLDDDSSASSSSSSSQIMHDREPLKLASTEKTIIYRHNVHKTRNKNKDRHISSSNSHHDKSSTDRPTSLSSSYSTTDRFKPSPIDLSPPVHFEPDQDFYTATINKGGGGGGGHHHKKGSRRRQQHHLMRDDHSGHHHSSNGHGHGQIYSDDQEYEKEQPDFQHAVNYLQSNLNKNSMDIYPLGQSNNNNNNGGDHGTLVSKQDRILHQNVYGFPQQMTTVPSMIPAPYMVDPTVPMPGMMMDSSRLKNQYFAGSEQINYPVHPPLSLQSTPQSSYAGGTYHHQGAGPNNVAYAAAASAAGQNYYQGASAGGHYPNYHHQQTAATDHQGGSSWTSTFFLLAGLIALSAIVAFFLPSFLAAGTTTGKDTGDIDKIAEIESSPDLWTEIKGLYGDIVNIVKGDYTAFHRQGVRPTDLPNIQIVDGGDEQGEGEEEDDGQSKVVINKRQGVISGSSDEEDDDDEQNFHSKNHHQQEDEEEEEEEDVDDNLKKKMKKGSRKNVNISDTLAFGVYGPGSKVVGNRLFNSSRNVNFANVFNQTLQAWEKVPLIVHR